MNLNSAKILFTFSPVNRNCFEVKKMNELAGGVGYITLAQYCIFPDCLIGLHDAVAKN